MIGNFERDQSGSRGENIKPYQKKASTAFALNSVVFVDANGFLDVAVATTTAASIVGVIKQAVVATDADYASNSYVAVDVANKGDNGEWYRASVGTGTPAQTMVGETHDLTAAGKVDLVAVLTNVVKVQQIISPTEVFVSFV